MIYYCITTLIVIFFAFLAGCLIKDILKINLKYISFSSPIGFLGILAILQIGYYVIILKSFPDNYFIYYTISVFGIILLGALIRYKAIVNGFKELINSKYKFLFSILISMIIVLVFYHVKFNYKLDDINFYGEYIPNRVGGNVEYNFSYTYTGIYIFYSIVLKLSHYLEIIGIYTYYYDVGFVIWVPALLGIYFFSLIITDFYSYLKTKTSYKNLPFILLIFLLGIVFLDLWYFEYPHFGVTFRRLPLIYLLYILEEDSHEASSLRRTLMIGLLMGSLYAISSSGFFISMIILYCYFIYNIMNDKYGYMFKIGVGAAIPIVFACIMYKILIIPILALYVFVVVSHLFKFDKYIEWLLNKCRYIILVGVPAGIIFLTYIKPFFEQWYIDLYIGGRGFFDPINSFDMVPDILNFNFDLNGLFNILFWMLIILYLLVSLYRKKRTWTFWLLVALILNFYNPFVYTFISTGLTSVAYFRISDIFYNIVILGNIILFFVNDENKMLKTIAICFSLMLFALKVATFRLPHFTLKEFNHLYHIDDGDIEVMEILERDYLSKDDKQSYNFASQIYGAQLFSKEKIDNILEDRFAYVVFDSSEFERVFYRRQPGVEDTEVDYSHACGLALSKNLDYVIIDAQYNWQLQEGLWPCAEVLFEHDYYRVLKMNYDYYNYNLQQGIVEEYVADEN